MKACLILEDQPHGLATKLVWQGSGHLDHLPDSIVMHLMAQFTEQIRQMDQMRLLRVIKTTEP